MRFGGVKKSVRFGGVTIPGRFGRLQYLGDLVKL